MSGRSKTAFILLIILLIGLMFLNLIAGSVKAAPSEVIQALFGKGDSAVTAGIVRNIRFPRLLAASLLGGALSVAGFLLQIYFNNPIAGPFVLGISSGAKLVVALSMIACLSRGIVLHASGMIAAAFCGAVFSMSFVLLATRVLRGRGMLIVCGVMIGYICSAVTEIAVTFADDANIVNLHSWSQGSFSGIGWHDIGAAAIVVFASLAFAVLLSKPMDAYRMGEAYARSMGVNIRRFRVGLILLSSILSACVTAFAGPVSFVGIAVPQLMKGLMKTTKPILMIPACFLGGSVFCLFCDLLARLIFAPTELSISSVTAVFGAPVVIWTLVKRRRE